MESVTFDYRTHVEQVNVVRVRDGGIGDFVRVVSDDGATGIFGPVDQASALFALGQLAPAVVGERVADCDEVWSRMRRAHRHTSTGLAVVAMSAIDCALWDLRGKLAGRPVFELLGEPVREAIPVYASLLGADATATTLPRQAVRALRHGFAGVKLPLMSSRCGDLASVAANVGVVQTLREAIGPNAPLMFDAFGGWTLEYAREWCNSVREFDVAWLEEPLPRGDVRGIAELIRAVAVPIAAGEHAYTLCEAEALLWLGGVAVLQSDVSWCGLTEGMRVAAACSALGVPLCPHGAGLLPALHLAAVHPASVVPSLEYHLALEPRRQRWLANRLEPNEGRLALPTQPGLGIELQAHLLRSAQIATRPDQLCEQ
jgi:L-rhamnonate dehydratase